MKILFLESIYPMNTRTSRIKNTLSNKAECISCCWNRSQEAENIKVEDIEYTYTTPIGYSKPIKKIYHILKYFFYFQKVVKIENPDVVIASQWDMMILASFNKKYKLIYENIDIPTSTNKYILKFLKKIETMRCINKCDAIIHASRFFVSLYNYFPLEKQLVLENLPSKTIMRKTETSYHSNKKRISFIGTVRYKEILINLVDAINELGEDYELYFVGEGHDTSDIKKHVKKNHLKNIFFTGKYDYFDIHYYYQNTDVIWAAYPNKDYNVKYAISNKFFESILFEKPCLFSSETLLGSYIDKTGLGIVVNPYDIDDIKEKVVRAFVEQEKIADTLKEMKLKENINIFWEDQGSYVENFLDKLM